MAINFGRIVVRPRPGESTEKLKSPLWTIRQGVWSLILRLYRREHGRSQLLEERGLRRNYLHRRSNGTFLFFALSPSMWRWRNGVVLSGPNYSHESILPLISLKFPLEIWSFPQCKTMNGERRISCWDFSLGIWKLSLFSNIVFYYSVHDIAKFNYQHEFERYFWIRS